MMSCSAVYAVCMCLHLFIVFCFFQSIGFTHPALKSIREKGHSCYLIKSYSTLEKDKKEIKCFLDSSLKSTGTYIMSSDFSQIMTYSLVLPTGSPKPEIPTSSIKTSVQPEIRSTSAPEIIPVSKPKNQTHQKQEVSNPSPVKASLSQTKKRIDIPKKTNETNFISYVLKDPFSFMIFHLIFLLAVALINHFIYANFWNDSHHREIDEAKKVIHFADGIMILTIFLPPSIFFHAMEIESYLSLGIIMIPNLFIINRICDYFSSFRNEDNIFTFIHVCAIIACFIAALYFGMALIAVFLVISIIGRIKP